MADERTTSKMMADWFQSGMTCREIADVTGLSQEAVRGRVKYQGCDTSRPKMHPMDPRHRNGLSIGKSVQTSRAVGDMIAACAARHGCTMWEAVDRLLR